MGCFEPQPSRDLLRRRHDGVDLERAAGLGILQHRGLEDAELPRHFHPRFAALVDLAADAAPDLLRLRHHAQHEDANEIVREDSVGRGAHYRGNGIHRHIAPELIPDIAPHVLTLYDFDAGAGENLGQTANAIRLVALGFAQDQRVAGMAYDAAGRGEIGRSVHHATDDLAEGDRARDAAVRIDRLKGRRRQRTTAFEEEPPGHAVHRRYYDRLRPDHRLERSYGAGEGRALHGDDQNVLRPKFGRAVACARARRDLRAVALNDPVAGAQRLQRRATRQHAHLVAGTCQGDPDPPADCARADNSDPHRA